MAVSRYYWQIVQKRNANYVRNLKMLLL